MENMIERHIISVDGKDIGFISNKFPYTIYLKPININAKYKFINLAKEFNNIDEAKEYIITTISNTSEELKNDLSKIVIYNRYTKKNEYTKFRIWDNISCIFLEWKEISQFTFDEVLNAPDMFTLSQFIGLKDCNGREIYENDIWKGCSDNSDWGFRTITLVVPRIIPVRLQFNLCDWTSGEIIGNIHENPKLIPHSYF